MIMNKEKTKRSYLKKIACVAVVASMSLFALAGCGSSEKPGDAAGGEDQAAFDTAKEITVVTREEGSGTRSAFVELTGILTEDEAGNETDLTVADADVSMQTGALMTQVAGDEYSIGYISVGSLNETVKALSVDGAEPSAENIKSGAYPISRPFNIATKGDLSPAAQDFMNYIMSAEGQEIVSANGYIQINDSAAAFAGTNPSGKVVVAGSSSVTPLMEKLQEAYAALNGNVEIEIQQSDSSTGMANAIAGTCDIGMASRELKDAEKAELTGTPIAVDGIAVIVNNVNPLQNLTMAQIKDIYIGTHTVWDNVK